MNRQTEKERERREEEGAVNPFPTVCHICGLTQTGKQAALLRKPQNHPTEKFRTAVREGVRVSESGGVSEQQRERERETTADSLVLAVLPIYLDGLFLSQKTNISW